MDNALKNLFAVSDLRNRVLFTLGLVGVWMLMALFSVVIFERETILTRWR